VQKRLHNNRAKAEVRIVGKDKKLENNDYSQTSLENMRNILVPVNSKKGILRLLPKQCESQANKC